MASLPIICIAGFVFGTLWQSRQEATRALPLPTITSSEVPGEVSVPTTDAKPVSHDPNERQDEAEWGTTAVADDTSLKSQERQLAEAMEDPEFKKLHDHIMRGQTQEWNFPALPNRSVPAVKE